MARTIASTFVAGVLLLGLASVSPAGALKKCAADSVPSGTVCMDKYEESVWRIPDPLGANKALVAKVRKGKATEDDRVAAGATRLGETVDDYAPCEDAGRGCTDIFAVSVAGVTPSREITWFQAQQACKNSGKRLPSNAEWQAAVAGTPDATADDGVTDCNTADANAIITLTGSRSHCVSNDGAFDMVGNLNEFVADWMPRSTGCGAWGIAGGQQCLAGADTTGTPGVLIRGGQSKEFSNAGPLSVTGESSPLTSFNRYGLRCAR